LAFSISNKAKRVPSRTPVFSGKTISLNSISIGVDIGVYRGNTTNYSNNKFYGLITQPLIIKTAKYNINGFIPKWDLKPLIYSNVIFWLENNIDVNPLKSIIENQIQNNTHYSEYQLPLPWASVVS
jgi:hypothetical protein